MSEAVRLAELFARLSDELANLQDEPVTFNEVAQRALVMVPGCDHCGITLRTRRNGAEVAAATSGTARKVDELQNELEEGPCFDAAFENEDFLIRDLGEETRWPGWVAGALDLGIRSTYAVALRGEKGVLGALNFHSEKPGMFADPDERVIADVFASHANNALAKSRLVTGLREAMESRHTIGIAQGVLAVRYDISFDRAFEVMHRYSNDHNIKLRVLAAEIMRTRGLPEETQGD